MSLTLVGLQRTDEHLWNGDMKRKGNEKRKSSSTDRALPFWVHFSENPPYHLSSTYTCFWDRLHSEFHFFLTEQENFYLHELSRVSILKSKTKQNNCGKECLLCGQSTWGWERVSHGPFGDHLDSCPCLRASRNGLLICALLFSIDVYWVHWESLDHPRAQRRRQWPWKGHGP